MGLELGHVGLPVLKVADAVEQDLQAAQSQAAGHAPAKIDHLRVERRIEHAQRLHAELGVLAEAAGLRALVAEDRQLVGEFHGLGFVRHPVLQVGPAD